MNRNAKFLQTKSYSHNVKEIGAVTFEVYSGTSGNSYTVVLLGNGGAACTCDWAKYRPSSNQGRCGCSHVVAVYDYMKVESGRKVSVWADLKAAQRQHRPTLDIGDGLLLTSRKVAR